MLLDAETFDLVQHIDTMLAAVERPRARAADQRRAHAVGARDRDARVPNGRRRAELADAAAGVRHGRRARERAACRLRRHPPVQPVRAAADHGQGPLPRTRRPAAVRRAPRAHLRHARPRRGRRPGEGSPGRERHAPAARTAARALCDLPVLARRADGPRLEPTDGLLRLPPFRPAATLPRLRGLRRRRRTARALRVHRGLHAHLVGHPAPPALRDDRGPHLRRRDARRGRGRHRRVLPGAREAATASATTPGRRSRRTTASSRARTSG